jgi:hypothetical protein
MRVVSMHVQRILAVVVVLTAVAIVGPSPVATGGNAVLRVRAGGTIGPAERAKLRSFMLRSARLLGELHPTGLEAVRTTGAKYRQRFGIRGVPPSSRSALSRAGSIYVVQMHGHFRLPSGATNAPTFPYDEVFLRAKTTTRIVALLRRTRQPLAPLGPVARL